MDQRVRNRGHERRVGRGEARQPSDGEAAAPAGQRGRGRGSHHRGRGRRDHHHRGRGHPAASRVREEEEEGENGEESKEEDGYSGVFSKRKLISNWDRYEAEEKENLGESVPLQRGADFNVLLSSAGDSFAQFRFADEKEWDIDVSSNIKMSTLFVDCQSLAKCLQQLPLHVRLNVEPELIQESVPVDIPQMTVKSTKEPLNAGLFSGPPELPRPAPSLSQPSDVSAVPPQPEVDDLDKDLDILLNLESPLSATVDILPPETITHVTQSVDNSSATQTEELKDLEPPSSHMEEKKKQELTEDDLEEWLDSMIS
ncbi:cell death regulator Aven isoform X2 [Polypterus senegalus]|uniref:cell death regulator Aven isoform X2 n=1 Tax=Polypterus senegalus TaxID=55291 RepID=UPI001963A660|nr:cell death regulator Aven isoform X2 [Polypterus senegalus]